MIEDRVVREIPTKCLPLLRHDIVNERMIELTKCQTCGQILGEYDDDMEIDNQWWCCCKCLSEFCPICSDAFLTDETGLCHMCDDPEIAIVHAVKSRKISE